MEGRQNIGSIRVPGAQGSQRCSVGCGGEGDAQNVPTLGSHMLRLSSQMPSDSGTLSTYWYSHHTHARTHAHKHTHTHTCAQSHTLVCLPSARHQAHLLLQGLHCTLSVPYKCVAICLHCGSHFLKNFSPAEWSSKSAVVRLGAKIPGHFSTSQSQPCSVPRFPFRYHKKQGPCSHCQNRPMQCFSLGPQMDNREPRPMVGVLGSPFPNTRVFLCCRE